jgi:rhamnosyl/mannosyltransferase
MKILHLAKYYWPRSGGMERVVQDLAEGSADLGHDVRVVAVEKLLGQRGGRGPGTTVRRVLSVGALGQQELAPGYLAAAWRGADIVHLHHPHPLADVATMLRLRRTRLVITHHGDAGHSLDRFWARRSLKRAQRIVVPSRAHIALSGELPGFEDKTDVVPFGIDVERWADVPPPPERGPVRALFIGRLLPWKGVDVLLRALALAPELRLDVVGEGPDAPRLRTLAQAVAVSDRVRWFGNYPDEDVPRRMAEAHFLVLPSVTVAEMFGLVLLEAMASGRPIITTELPSGVREVNAPGVTGLEVPPRDPAALAAAMISLAGNPARCREMGEAGRARVQERFTRRAMVEAYLRIYQAALEGR